MHDLIIVGGGPAGIAAGVYAARKQLKTLLISVDIGGQINNTWGIENYLGYQFIEGPELINKFQTQVSQFPIDQKIGDKVSQVSKIDGGFEAVTEAGDKYQAKAVILATGKKPRKLNVPGETELTGRGVTYCAICDGPVFTGQRVAVVGGGNSALEATLDMVKIAEHVDLVSLTPLTGDPILISQLANAKNLSVFTEHQTVEIKGKDLVEGALIKDIKNGKEKHLDVTGVFIEIGLVPNSDAVKGLVELNKQGEVTITPTCETTVPGLYAAGDVTDVPEKQIIVAAGEGAKAALQAHRYLQRLVK
ncbi:MAG TPA: FAD-dependent oxidoreductase [Dehalococcoidales bacterium]|nr:FAD-dependent oxidoreductase [Dehalococcoidales bacterium]